MTTSRLANYPDREQQNLLKTFDYTQINSLPELTQTMKIRRPVVMERDCSPMTKCSLASRVTQYRVFTDNKTYEFRQSI